MASFLLFFLIFTVNSISCRTLSMLENSTSNKPYWEKNLKEIHESHDISDFLQKKENDTCATCVYLHGQRLYECMQELDNKKISRSFLKNLKKN